MKPAAIVRGIVDYLAPIVWILVVLIKRDMQLATWFLVGACALAVAIGLIFEKRVAPMPLFIGLAAVLFGGLTLFFHDSKFVKMKMTAVDSILALVLVGGVLMGKNPLKALFAEGMTLPDGAWKTLTFRYAGFFAACAIANEVIRRLDTSDQHYAIWRGIALGLAFVFAIANVPFMMKNMEQPDAPPPELPDGG
jgi:intracellular septation protein